MAGSSTAELQVSQHQVGGEAPAGPAFFFDLRSPEAYLAAESALQEHPGVEWVPVRSTALPGAETYEAFRCAEERASVMADVELRAYAAGLQPVRWPDPFPFDSELALRAAAYAKSIGRVVAFTLAAFRQAYAGGQVLDETYVLIAASACEMHPRAVLQALKSDRVGAQLDAFTERARSLGVRDVPAVA
jgi:2-hydroxychromene-2-carboxylate isomerase